MNKILIIEDNDEINHLLADMVRSAGYEPVSAYSGPEGFRYFGEDNFSLILLDLMLPGMSGEVILEKVREISQVPIIVISAKAGMDGKVNLLENGADDYITKPFDVREVLARIQLQLRKHEAITNTAGKDDILEYGELVLNQTARRLTVNAREVTLTRHEYNIVELLMKHPNKVYSKQELFELAWEEYYIGEDKTLNVHVSNIRKKLKELTEVDYVETIWGIGYRLKKI